MGIIKKRKNSLTKIIIKSLLFIGLCMLLVSGGLLVLLGFFEHKGFFTPDTYPRIELGMLLLYILLIIILIFIVSYCTAKKIQKRGQLLIELTNKIKQQDLNFEVKPTGIMEIDQVLDAIDELKIALSKSLLTQWKLEQNKQYQLSALMHDLKTPLTILKGNFYLLEYENLTKEGYKSLEDSKDSMLDMEYYIQQLLEISQTNNKAPTTIETCNLTELIEEIISSMEVLFISKEINLDLQVDLSPILVLGNSYELKRAFQNVLSNAIDFTPKSSEIQVVLQQLDTIAQISIKDSGKGFSTDSLKYATEPFYMEDTSRNRKQHYGLGLSITEHIIKKYHGNLQITNDALHSGGKIIIQLPLLKEETK